MSLALVLAAVLSPGACVTPPEPPPPNPFAGSWTTPEHGRIAFLDNTVMVDPGNAQSVAMSPAACDGAFRFTYGRKSREELLRLAPARQPDLGRRLAGLLALADYPVAELTCGTGKNTYVLLDQRELLAIYRDRDIAGVERLSRL